MADKKSEKPEGAMDEDVEEIDAAEGESEEEVDDELDVTGEATQANIAARLGLAGQLMQNPQALAALQGRLDGMAGLRSGYIESLPKVVKRRIKALKKLQFDMIKIEADFYKEVHELECKYANQYTPIFDRRKEVLTGGLEPTDSDCDWPSDDDEEDDEEKLADDLQKKAQVKEIDETKKDEEEKTEENKEKEEESKLDETTKGVPEFWLTIFKNVDMLADMVQDHDEPILKHLEDVKVKFQMADPMGFTLEFFFSKNEHFTNDILTKEYIMRAEPDPEDPFGFEGPEIIKCKGCTIDWQKGKNVTVKIVKKTQKHKGRGTKRTVTKTVQNDSFFNFFTPPEVPEDGEPDEDTEALLAADFEIGHYIRERIVPRAVLYFTGEALEEDDFDEEEGEEGDEEDYDEDQDPDYQPQPGDKPADCKQQ